MSGQQSRVEFVKKLIDSFTPEEKKEFARVLQKEMKPVPKVNNKIELQVG